MNTAKARSLLTVTIAAVVLITSGCATVRTSHRQDIGATRYPPSHPAEIEIIRFVPARPHVRLGEVQVKLPNPNVEPDVIEAALQKESAKLGANAVIVVYDRTQATGTVMDCPTWTRSLEAIKGCAVVGIAIKYP